MDTANPNSSTIIRDVAGAAGRSYDLIVLGGGIYGVYLVFESVRRGLSPLLIEQDDFGGATSLNSLRIIHGGFRYLQSLDLHRFRESVQERRWFLKTYPGLVKPLPCLMPLYGRGLHRPFILGAGLKLNDFLSRKRNIGLRPEQRLPGGRVAGPDQTREIFPEVVRPGLKGGAIWHDAWMPDSQRVLMETLRWACGQGATALNYVQARELLSAGRQVSGITVVDRETGAGHEFKAKVVINAGGPWSRELAARFDRDEEALFKSSLAWNALLDRPPPSDHALALAPPRPGGRIYFLVPWKGRLMAGTGHAPRPERSERPQPSTREMEAFLDDLNQALPALRLNHKDVIRTYAGFLPAIRPGSADLAVREVILDHGRNGGPAGLYSLSGVKFTTSRLVAAKTLNRIFGKVKSPFPGGFENPTIAPESDSARGRYGLDWRPDPLDDAWQEDLKTIIAEESVVHLDDLVLRRTSLGENPARLKDIAPLAGRLFGWDEDRCRKEYGRLEKKG